MTDYKGYIDGIFSIKDSESFRKAALEAFSLQYKYNPVYREYADLTGIVPENVTDIDQIPFLPIKLFKNRKVETALDMDYSGLEQKTFTSSATTGMIPSSHIVRDISIYEKSFLKGFEQFYGKPSEYAFLGLLPSYLERDGSSLVYMVDRLMKESADPDNGYYLYNYTELEGKLRELKDKHKKTILFGVTFALLEMAGTVHDMEFPDLIVIETGGMKGRGKEVRREEVHKILETKFSVKAVHSEYGMAELLSQAYSCGQGVFRTPEWMKVMARDLYDPFSYVKTGHSGGLNIIDLANINSCCFIETEDKGRVMSDGSFTVEGRIKDAELRGCNMLIE